MSKKIVGKVADLIDNRSLVFNKGSNAGVTKNMIFRVLDPVGREVKDPDNGKVIGHVNLPKIEVQVTHVYDKYSIAKTYKFREINVGGSGSLSVGNIFTPPKYVKKYDTFEIDESVQKQIDEKKSIVKIGDVVEQVTEDELAVRE